MSSKYLQKPDWNASAHRRGHTPQISISDNNHHVTEAIGGMYGDNDWMQRDNRPLSFAPSQSEAQLERKASKFSSTSNSSSSDTPLSKSLQGDRHARPHVNGSLRQKPRTPSIGSTGNGQSSPPSLTRSSSTDTANHAFPLNDIDYESSPAAVAQELSNLQAIRRMSMNVDAADPDLPSFSSGGIGMPAVAPSGSDDENDAARLFWVPARLHPELAPKEFKTFVEDRVDRIKKTSGGDEDSLSPTNSVDRHGSAGANPNRRRSMLSKTIEIPSDYKDGADVLERKRSSHHRTPSVETSLQELESLVSDPSELVRKMSLDVSRRSLETNPESPTDDVPIVAVPAGQTLKRSTRTQYRRGSVRAQGRVGKRPGARGTDRDEGTQRKDHSPAPDIPPVPTINIENLSRIRTEPVAVQQGRYEEGSVQSRTHQALHAAATMDENQDDDTNRLSSEAERPQPRPFHSRIARNGKTTAHVPGYTGPAAAVPVPEIVQTPPTEARHSLPPVNPMQPPPDRKTSHEFSRSNSLPSLAGRGGAASRPAFGSKKQQQPPEQSMEDMANHSSHTMGTNTSTDAISFIPTLQEDKRAEKQDKKVKGLSSEIGSKKGWGWLRGSSDQKKEEKEEAKKAKARVTKGADKIHDSTRLDVLQTATDGPRGRESLVLNRDDSANRLEEERRKDNARRSGGQDGKKEKEGIFSSLFGGGKKKGDRDSGGKKIDRIRGLSPEPPRRLLRADIDYNWTRFSILEERAIYRMAHIKLANPRRALYSQVLLSNFMYSYLAKVQQMHPQIQIPTYQQKGKGQTAQQQKESEEMVQWQRYQEQQEQAHSSDATHNSNGNHAYPSDPHADEADFIEDYDPQHQQVEDARHVYSEGRGSHMEGGRGHYSEDGHGSYAEQSRGGYGDDSRSGYGEDSRGYAEDGHGYAEDGRGTYAEHIHRQRQRSEWTEQDQDPYARQGLFEDEHRTGEGEMW